MSADDVQELSEDLANAYVEGLPPPARAAATLDGPLDVRDSARGASSDASSPRRTSPLCAPIGIYAHSTTGAHCSTKSARGSRSSGDQVAVVDVARDRRTCGGCGGGRPGRARVLPDCFPVAPPDRHVDAAASAAHGGQAYCAARACGAQGLLRERAHLYVVDACGSRAVC